MLAGENFFAVERIIGKTCWKGTAGP